MAKVIRRHWQSEASAGLPRRDRQSCEYEAYVPDPLMGRVIVLDGAVAADVADAEAAITRLNLEARALVDTEALARLLLRAESVASSRIEGLEIGPRRLLEAEAARSTRAEEHRRHGRRGARQHRGDGLRGEERPQRRGAHARAAPGDPSPAACGIPA